MGQEGGEDGVTKVACVRVHVAAMFHLSWMLCFAVCFRSTDRQLSK